MIETELWTSFVSLLRSYAAAGGLSSGEVHVSSTTQSVTISAFAVELEMYFDSALGQVSWQKRLESSEADSGTFVLLPEGKILIGETTKDLDHAAIDFIASVTESAKGGPR